MTLEEAAATLTLDPEGPFQAATIRAAYLAAVRRHRPETDPEGFKRVREAYELLLTYGSLAEPSSPVAHLAPTPPGPAAPGRDLPSPVTVAAPASLRQRLAALPPRPWRPRVALAREAYESCPTDAAARELLVQELARAGQTAGIIAVLREGARAGDRWCAWKLVAHFPLEASEEELEQLRQAGLAESLFVATARTRRGQTPAAAELVEQALASVEVESLPDEVIEHVVTIVLGFHQEGDGASAGKAFAALRRVLGPHGMRAGARGATTVLYLVCAELDGVPELPFDLRHGVARAALMGDSYEARQAMAVFARAEGAREAARWEKRLAQKAPAVRRILGQAPVSREAPLALAALGLVGLICLVLYSKASVPPPRPDLSPAGERPFAMAELQRRTYKLCRGEVEPPGCDTLRLVLDTLRRPYGCTQLPVSRETLARMLVGATGDMKDRLGEVVQLLSEVCPGM
jgi:hypothetical protein